MYCRIGFNKFTDHPGLSRHIIRYFLCCFFIMGLTLPCFAQELEPRRWSHLPKGSNFFGGAYSYTNLDISFDPALLIEDAEAEIHTWALKYIRTFELFEKSSRIEFVQGYQKGHWSGLLDGVPRSINRSGLTDSIVRFAVNLIGAPPLEGEKYAAYRAGLDVETILGIALVLHLPTGDYMEDKLINLGSNRFTFRTQAGVVHSRGNWSIEFDGSVWFFTDNDEFYNGNELEQDPLYTFQTHLVYTFRPGLWVGSGIGYGYGGESSVNGIEKNDRKGNLAWALNFGYPVTRQFGIKVSYLGLRTQEPVGYDSDSIAAALSFFW
jgi:hypothetical protein